MVNQWDFLTGSLAQLKAVWSAYHIAVQVAQGQIDHTPALFVIDQQGREQKLYLTQMAYSSVGQSAQVLADELSSLLPGHPHVAGQGSLASITVQGPSDHVALPSATGDTNVVLGPGSPHLVLFFATWLSEVSDLKSELIDGNAYSAAARKAGLPPLVAVDETVVEPSAQAVRTYLSGLGTSLSYPVALDTTGRVADGYNVQDQPWLALVSASGKVIWSHDGWLSVPVLTTAVHHALKPSGQPAGRGPADRGRSAGRWSAWCAPAAKYRLAGVEHGAYSRNRLTDGESQQCIRCLPRVLLGNRHPGRDQPGDDGDGE
jgi:hypothetical protein